MKTIFEKLLVLVTIAGSAHHMHSSVLYDGICSSQDVADTVRKTMQQTLARNYAQIDELLAPVLTFLQATFMKQVLAEYDLFNCF